MEKSASRYILKFENSSIDLIRTFKNCNLIMSIDVLIYFPLLPIQAKVRTNYQMFAVWLFISFYFNVIRNKNILISSLADRRVLLSTRMLNRVSSAL